LRVIALCSSAFLNLNTKKGIQKSGSVKVSIQTYIANVEQMTDFEKRATETEIANQRSLDYLLCKLAKYQEMKHSKDKSRHGNECTHA
jgi:hypothetical protein